MEQGLNRTELVNMVKKGFRTALANQEQNDTHQNEENENLRNKIR